MYLRLDHHSGEAIYRQIVEAVKYKVASGELSPEAQLPSIRALAEQLQINPRTVVKAYEELEHVGVVVMRQGMGVFVGLNHGVVPVGVRRQKLAELARRLLAEGARLGADTDEMVRIVEQEAKNISGPGQEPSGRSSVTRRGGQ
jgi:GntR family transcriptional regulator